MSYFSKIKELTRNISADIVDFSAERKPARIPTQASSEFITNKEQGDWAESLIFDAVNSCLHDYVAVKYGKSDNVVAGEEGFGTFFQEFQDELDTIGKRPDILIFRKEDFQEELGKDISKRELTETTEYVKKAVMGIEVRSSSFLIDEYTEFMDNRTKRCTEDAIRIKNDLLDNYKDVFDVNQNRKAWQETLKAITADNLKAMNLKVPGWHTDSRSAEANVKLKTLKKCINTIQKREFLSITPKVEDIKVVYKWVETFGVPHFYFQVFFDKVFGISFENILSLIGDPGKEGEIYFIEKDAKNQNKTTIKIDANYGIKIAGKVTEPGHESKRKKMDRGRLLYYVKFSGGKAYLDAGLLKKLFENCEREKHA